MGLKLIWTNFALDQLKTVYHFYKEIATKKVAKRIVDEIYQAPNTLKDLPKSGQID